MMMLFVLSLLRQLDVDGDGYLTKDDLNACLPEIGVTTERGDVEVLLEIMDSHPRKLGQVALEVRHFALLIKDGDYSIDVRFIA